MTDNTSSTLPFRKGEGAVLPDGPGSENCIALSGIIHTLQP
jgi:hypothetical protein